MALHKKPKFDLQRICKQFSIDNETIENAKVEVEDFPEELNKIFIDFTEDYQDLERIKNNILNLLNDKLQGKVHSIRARVKNADHLIEKIIRNVNDNPDKYAKINVDNYYKIVTDLIGVRIIILDKYDWKEIHQSLLAIFINDPKYYPERPEDIVENFDRYYDKEDLEDKLGYHAEKPIVYITSADDRDVYQDDNLNIDEAKKHYRSIHYIIRYDKIYFEIQVRTLFEEGWLEFDHRVKYPYDKDNEKKQEYIEILSSLAIAADRLISFYTNNEKDFKISVSKKKPQEETLKESESPASQTLQDKIISRY